MNKLFLLTSIIGFFALILVISLSIGTNKELVESLGLKSQTLSQDQNLQLSAPTTNPVQGSEEELEYVEPDHESNEIIVINSNQFSPASYTLGSGTPLTFENEDSVAHVLVAELGSFTTKSIDPGHTDTITISKPGTYTYYSQNNPALKGTIIVK